MIRPARDQCQVSPRSGTRGFTLIELMIVLAIVAILAAIAYPSYIDYITRSRRAAAEACLSNYADYMERYYATNLSYSMSTSTFSGIGLDCATPQNSGANYSYTLASDSSTAYAIDATPTGVQLTRDTACGTLTLDQTGARNPAGGDCWQQ